MSLSVHSLKQVKPYRGMHPIHYLNDRYGEAWMYVGRAGHFKGYTLEGSPLGNPFRVGANHSRGTAAKRYRYWLWEQMQVAGTNPVLGTLCAIAAWEGDLRLYCWCHQPGPCHAHVIVSAVNWLRSSEGQTFLIARL